MQWRKVPSQGMNMDHEQRAPTISVRNYFKEVDYSFSSENILRSFIYEEKIHIL